jgi:hypothetical protein
LLSENKNFQQIFEEELENSAVVENLLRIIDFSGEKNLRFTLESLISIAKVLKYIIEKSFFGLNLLFMILFKREFKFKSLVFIIEIILNKFIYFIKN